MIRWLVALLLLAGPATAQEVVRFASTDGDLRGGVATGLTGYLYRPAGPGPHPAVVALHGCGGLFDRGTTMGARHQDWADRMVAMGFVVLFPDSFNSRGFRQICTVRDRPVSPSRERPRDARGALEWLRAQPFVRADRIVLFGWSNGGSTVLYAIDGSRGRAVGEGFAAAIAFYPGCTTPANRAWRPAVPLLLLIGEADNWTPAPPCIRLRGRGSIEVVAYPGAFHDFDHPNLPLRERTGLTQTADGGGRAMIGTDPAARADAIARVTALLRSFTR